MKPVRTFNRFVAAVALALLAGRPAQAVDFPLREKLERDGWTIGFSPADRPVAEALAAHLMDFEKRFAAMADAKLELGPAEVEARTAEIALALAKSCGLPGREADFQREIGRSLPQIRGLQAKILATFLLRSIEIWREGEVRDRIKAGEKIPGLIWDEKTGKAHRRARFNWTLNAQDYSITTNVAAPPATMLILDETRAIRPAVDVLQKDFASWVDGLRGFYADSSADAVRRSMAVATSNLLHTECSPGISTMWICAGMGGWAWREWVVTALPRKSVDRYALRVAQLPVPSLGGKPINLEAWPRDREDDSWNMARQVFCNIAERHGAETVSRLMGEFWNRPKAERNTASLKRVYAELLHEPLEGRAPWRSLGVAEEKNAGVEKSG
ncbi:MAG TPA: hypothetical protein VHO24_13660 [Opitutaceae bacterium]|nr:hypothetical protein [Opitutaceae bacterium]